MGNLGNFFTPRGGKSKGDPADHSAVEGGDLFRPSQSSRLSGNTHGPVVAPNIGNFQKVQDRINAQARLNPKSRTAKMEENALKRSGSGGKYYVYGSEQLKKIAPELANSWKKAMPDSFASSDMAKKTMGRILGGKGDAWISAAKLREMQNAVKEGKWSSSSLERLTPKELSKIKNNTDSRRAFISGIHSLNKEKFY